METKAAKESELQHARKPTVQFEDQFPPAPRDKFSNESSKVRSGRSMYQKYSFEYHHYPLN